MNAVDGSASAATASLSVIVPFYDVEAYLADCLESVAVQTHRDLEVICIDDGSADGSGAIADGFAARDPRFRVVRQANAGLGAARNAGARLARGRYLAFLDSDDLVHPDAYAPMIRSLETSGSDFATGRIERLTSVGLRPSPTFAPIFARPRTATHVTRDHVLLLDRLTTQKVWRRSFWEEHGLAFPEGVLYEDINVAVPAHFLARSVDVLNTPMYQWRIREGADRSITQRRLELRNMRDRVAAVTTASAFIASGGWDAEKREYDRLVLTGDLRYFAVLLDRADAAFADDFVARAGAFVRQAHADSIAALPAVERLRWHLIGEGAVEEASNLAQYLRREGTTLPTRRRWGRVLLDVPVLGGRSVPRSVVDVTDEVELRTRVTGFALTPQRLTIDVEAGLRHLATTGRRRPRLAAWLVPAGGGRRLAMEVERPDGGSEDGARAAAAPGGFRLTIPTDAITGRWTAGTDRWRVELRLRSGWLRRRGRLTGPGPGPPRRPRPLDAGSLRLTPRADGTEVGLSVSRPTAILTACRPSGDSLDLVVCSRRGLAGLEVRRGSLVHRLPVRRTGDDEHVAILDVGAFADAAAPIAAEEVWTLHAVAEQGGSPRIVAGSRLDQQSFDAGGRELSVDITRYGNVSIGRRPGSVWLDDVRVDGAGFVLTGSSTGVDEGGVAITLQPREHRGERAVATEVVDGRLEIRVSAYGDAPSDGSPLPAGTYELRASSPGTGAPEVDVRTRRSLTYTLPLEVTLEGRPVRLDDLSWQRPALVVGDDLRPEERGDEAQRRLLAAALADRHIDPSTVLFVASAGRATDGDVGAVARLLAQRHGSCRLLGAVRDRRVTWPSGVEPVRYGGEEWYRAVADAGTIVTSCELPRGFVRAEGQRVVRTFDGRPVRPTGLLEPDVARGHDRYREQVRHQAAQWTHIVSDGPATSQVIRSSFEPDAMLVEVGRPALDVLAEPDELADRLRALRAALGLQVSDRTVLWTPTWSPEARHPGGAPRSTPELDVVALRRALPDDLTVLSRSHPLVDDRLGIAATAGVLDVSDHPDLVDLLALADVVVTPPTSVALDARQAGAEVVVFDPGEAWAAAAVETLDPYGELPFARVTTAASLGQAIRSALADAPRASAPSSPPRSGGAASRLVDRLFPTDP